MTLGNSETSAAKPKYLAIKKHTDDLLRGDFVYHNHELLRVTFVGKWRFRDGRNERYYRFRKIGRVNLDKTLGVGGGD